MSNGGESNDLQLAWRDYFAHGWEAPRRPAARDYMIRDLQRALERLVPSDASVLEVGCGGGDLIGALPNPSRAGIDLLPEVIDLAGRKHPGVELWQGDVMQPGSLPSERRWDAIICDRLCHSVLDVRKLLESLRSHLTDNGRIFLTTFNYLWEVPARVAEQAGWKRPAPTSNWLSEIDYDNLFALSGLEVVRYEDRMMLPLDLPLLSSTLNRYAVKLPVMQRTSLYRVYVLRRADQIVEPKPVSVSVIVPTRNEAGNVQAAIDRTPLMGSRTELIFVEGGSSDGTWEKIQECLSSYRGPLELKAFRQTGKGKGDAVRLGFSEASGDLLMILDADLTVPPEELPAFYSVAVRRQADFVQGTRLVYPMERGAMRFFNKLGNLAFSQLFSFLLNQPIRDTLCGTKVLWRSDYERIAAGRSYFGDFDPFGDFDLIFGAARLNLKLLEIPIRYRDRTYGSTNISRWKHGLLLLRMSAVAARKLKFV